VLSSLRVVNDVPYVTTSVFGGPMEVDKDKVHLKNAKYAYYYVKTN